MGYCLWRSKILFDNCFQIDVNITKYQLRPGFPNSINAKTAKVDI